MELERALQPVLLQYVFVFYFVQFEAQCAVQLLKRNCCSTIVMCYLHLRWYFLLTNLLIWLNGAQFLKFLETPTFYKFLFFFLENLDGGYVET